MEWDIWQIIPGLGTRLSNNFALENTVCKNHIVCVVSQTTLNCVFGCYSSWGWLSLPAACSPSRWRISIWRTFFELSLWKITKLTPFPRNLHTRFNPVASSKCCTHAHCAVIVAGNSVMARSRLLVVNKRFWLLCLILTSPLCFSTHVCYGGLYSAGCFTRHNQLRVSLELCHRRYIQYSHWIHNIINSLFSQSVSHLPVNILNLLPLASSGVGPFLCPASVSSSGLTQSTWKGQKVQHILTTLG